MSSITIVGLGPGKIDDLTLAAWRCLENAGEVYLRTKRHPLFAELPPQSTYHSFDAWYEEAGSFEALYQRIADQIITLAQKGQAVVYAVPGHPLVGEHTTPLIQAKAAAKGLRVTIIDGLSFIEPTLTALSIDAMAGLQIVDALDMAEHYHPSINPDHPSVIAQVYSREVASNVKLTLMNQYPDDFGVILVHGAGTTEAVLEEIPLYELDRSDKIAHLTSLYVPALPALSSFEALQNVMAHLRSERGCPWDQKQTRESLRPQLLEEVYEVLEAIDNEDIDALREELGDVLLHIIFQIQIATEEGDFYATDVFEQIITKLIRRHPHVWGDVEVSGSKNVEQNWEAIKQQEQADKAQKGEVARQSQLDGVPISLPALVYAYRLQERAAAVGFDWQTVEPVIQKVFEEIEEIKNDPSTYEFGDLLFAVVNWARWAGIDPESALRETNARFKRRFAYIEEQVVKSERTIKDFSLEELDAFWDAAKREGL